MEKADINRDNAKIEEEMNIINKYNCFLKQTLNKFNMIFLCHPQEEYVKMMKLKGREMERNNGKDEKRDQKESEKWNIKKGTKIPSSIQIKYSQSTRSKISSVKVKDNSPFIPCGLLNTPILNTSLSLIMA